MTTRTTFLNRGIVRAGVRVLHPQSPFSRFPISPFLSLFIFSLFFSHAATYVYTLTAYVFASEHAGCFEKNIARFFGLGEKEEGEHGKKGISQAFQLREQTFPNSGCRRHVLIRVVHHTMLSVSPSSLPLAGPLVAAASGRN